MLGHIKKDLIILWGDIAILMGFWLFYAIMVMIPAESVDSVLEKIIYVILCVFPMIVTMQLSGKPVSVDEASHWQGYGISLPGGHKRYIISKYMFGIAIQLFGMVLSYAYIILIRIRKDCNISYYLPLIIICITIFMMNLELPFYFRFGYRTGDMVKAMIFLFLVVVVFIYALFGNIDYFKNLDYSKLIMKIMNIGKHKVKYITLGMTGIFGMSLLSCFLSQKVYRRE